MLGTTWELSPRVHEMHVDHNVVVPVSAGHRLDADVYRPAGPGRFPVIVSPHPYSQSDQVAPLLPTAFSHRRGHMEAGDPRFYVRRGYAHALVNIRGTGRSGGDFDNLGQGTIDDVCDAIEWFAGQPWCDGQVVMFGASYFSLIAHQVAVRPPSALCCVFAPFAWTDAYRDRYYHGGILNQGFTRAWFETLPTTAFGDGLQVSWDPPRFEQALATARADTELSSIPFLANVLDNPDEGQNRVILELLLQPLDGEYYRERSVDYSTSNSLPVYFGACWGVYGNHLPGAIRGFTHWNGPKKLTIGPPLYLDRPLYQYAYESLRWFDHWTRGNDTGLMDEPPVQLFVDESGGRWRQGNGWPLPETRWTPFYLHHGGLLSEHELWPAEPASCFTDSPYERGSLRFTTPPFVEETEICGPIALTLWGSTTEHDVLWFVSLMHVDEVGNERLLTRGWLRGSQRAIDPARSYPWQPFHTHLSRDGLEPGETYRFDVEIRPYAIRMRPGNRLRLCIKCADEETPATALEAIAQGHIAGATHARVTVYHDGDHPSALLLPVVSGNRVGTFISGGVPHPPG
jgi:predicted acyl esterase